MFKVNEQINHITYCNRDINKREGIKMVQHF